VIIDEALSGWTPARRERQISLSGHRLGESVDVWRSDLE